MPPSIPPRQVSVRQALPSASRRIPVKRRRIWIRRVLVFFFLLVIVSMGGFWLWVESRINHVDALSGAADTPGETYLIVGSDARDGWADDGTMGARSDTIIVLHRPANGPTALISIPRDSYVAIPGHDYNKINAAYAFGGPLLLVQTVEQLTGLTIDHYVEVGFLGVSDVVDALGGVELCYDSDVNDPLSTMVWTAGCHVVDGPSALAFSRMRYSDPIGDIGRTQRQQQLVSAVAEKTLRPATLLNPFSVISVTNASLDSLRVNNGTHAIDLAKAALAFRSAQGSGAVTGTPPLVSLNYRVEGVGSTVRLDPDTIDEFWRKIADGSYAPGTQVGGALT
jgi:LCP family protein required for cell wall assembly